MQRNKEEENKSKTINLGVDVDVNIKIDNRKTEEKNNIEKKLINKLLNLNKMRGKIEHSDSKKSSNCISNLIFQIKKFFFGETALTKEEINNELLNNLDNEKNNMLTNGGPNFDKEATVGLIYSENFYINDNVIKFIKAESNKFKEEEIKKLLNNKKKLSYLEIFKYIIEQFEIDANQLNNFLKEKYKPVYKKIKKELSEKFADNDSIQNELNLKEKISNQIEKSFKICNKSKTIFERHPSLIVYIQVFIGFIEVLLAKALVESKYLDLGSNKIDYKYILFFLIASFVLTNLTNCFYFFLLDKKGLVSDYQKNYLECINILKTEIATNFEIKNKDDEYHFKKGTIFQKNYDERVSFNKGFERLETAFFEIKYEYWRVLTMYFFLIERAKKKNKLKKEIKNLLKILTSCQKLAIVTVIILKDIYTSSEMRKGLSDTSSENIISTKHCSPHQLSESKKTNPSNTINKFQIHSREEFNNEEKEDKKNN